MADVTGFYVSNSSHGASRETSRDASRIDWREKQWRHSLNNIFIFIFFSSYNVLKHVRYPSLISRQPGW